MNKYGVTTMLALTLVWMLLMEEFSWQVSQEGVRGIEKFLLKAQKK